MQNLLSVVGEIQPTKFNLSLQMCGVGMLAGSLLVRNFRLLNQNLVDSCHRSRSPLEEINHPSQRNYRPGKLHHVCEECDVAAQFHVAEEHLARSQPQHKTTAKPSMVSSVGQSIPISRTSFKLRAMYSLLAPSKAVISGSSCTYARIKRAPEKFSCTRAEISEIIA